MDCIGRFISGHDHWPINCFSRRETAAHSRMDKGDLIQAKELLIQAQQEAEPQILKELPEEG